jgi:hypothetical protein
MLVYIAYVASHFPCSVFEKIDMVDNKVKCWSVTKHAYVSTLNLKTTTMPPSTIVHVASNRRVFSKDAPSLIAVSPLGA